MTRLERSENVTTGDNAGWNERVACVDPSRYGGRERNGTLLSVVRAAIIFWKQISVGSQLDPHTAVCSVPPIVFYMLSVGIYATQCPLHRARSLSLRSTGVCIVKACWSFYGFKSRGWWRGLFEFTPSEECLVMRRKSDLSHFFFFFSFGICTVKAFVYYLWKI